MRHYKKGRKLGTDASHTKAIKKNLVVNLLLNDRVKTTLERAKEVRGDVDRVITWAKRGDVHSRRLAIAKLGDKDLVAELFSKVAQGMFEGRPGGYTRILRLGTRRGDGATIVILELVLEPVNKKKGTDSAKAAAKPDTKSAKAAKKAEKPEEEAVEEIVNEAEAVEEAAEAAAELTETAEAVEAEPEAEAEAEVEAEPEAEAEAEVEAEPEPATEAEPEAAVVAESESEPAEAPESE